MEEHKNYCPRCGAKNIVKNGKNKDKQRYICKNCGRSFVNTTNTPIYYSKKPLDTWKQYVQCLKNKNTLEYAAKTLSISVKTAFYWRHKLLDAMREHFTFDKFSANVQMGSTYINTCFKGNHSKDKYFRKEINYVDCRDRENNKIGILVAADDRKCLSVEAVSICHITVNDIIRVFQNKINEGTRVVTENILQYKLLCHKCKATQIVPKAFAREELDSVKMLKRKIVSFLRHYRGVATKYLSNYLSLFKYLEAGLEAALLSLRGKEPYYQENFFRRKPIFS